MPDIGGRLRRLKGTVGRVVHCLDTNALVFVGGGLWHPEPDSLAALRRDIDRRPQRLKGVLKGAPLRKEILGVTADDEKKVVSAFVKANGEDALKTKPKVSRFNIILFRQYLSSRLSRLGTLPRLHWLAAGCVPCVETQ